MCKHFEEINRKRIQPTRIAKVQYEYAMGLAMLVQDTTQQNKAINELKTIIHKYPIMQTWAKAGDSSDFLALKSNHNFREIIKNGIK